MFSFPTAVLFQFGLLSSTNSSKGIEQQWLHQKRRSSGAQHSISRCRQRHARKGLLLHSRLLQHRLEKLDKVKMTLTYKTLGDNIFIDYYHATLTMFPATEGKKGSLLMWHYILSPVGGFTNETAHFSIQDLAQVVARNVVNISN
ncbi:hypothetical protein Leryth_025354 [Lithospermum erythrorhizon]|nr:hypothetical protein Leryth_025354 [Lithospermum erythrorhizon]